MDVEERKSKKERTDDSDDEGEEMEIEDDEDTSAKSKNGANMCLQICRYGVNMCYPQAPFHPQFSNLPHGCCAPICLRRLPMTSLLCSSNSA